MNGSSLTELLSLSPQGQQELESSLKLISVDKSSVPIHKGDKVSGAYVVTKGCLRVFSYTPNGNESTFYQINPGETCVFAINCLFKKLLYPAWVLAEEDTEIAVINGSTFKSLFQKEPAIQSLTIDALSSAVFKLMTEVEHLQGWNLSQRVVNLLLNQADTQNKIRMTQQEIATRLGTTREVVARILGEMSSEKLLKTSRGSVDLLNTEQLANLISE